MTFTPGPWKYEVHQRGISWLVGPECIEEGIAPGGGDLIGIEVVAIAKDTEANARLIAAAPDLSEALKEYLDWHEVNFALPSGNFEDPDEMNLAKAARAALNRAGVES